jgi:hypothetical protein
VGAVSGGLERADRCVVVPKHIRIKWMLILHHQLLVLS